MKKVSCCQRWSANKSPGPRDSAGSTLAAGLSLRSLGRRRYPPETFIAASAMSSHELAIFKNSSLA
jgi:hypothetical protein